MNKSFDMGSDWKLVFNRSGSGTYTIMQLSLLNSSNVIYYNTGYNFAAGDYGLHCEIRTYFSCTYVHNGVATGYTTTAAYTDTLKYFYLNYNTTTGNITMKVFDDEALTTLTVPQKSFYVGLNDTTTISQLGFGGYRDGGTGTGTTYIYDFKIYNSSLVSSETILKLKSKNIYTNATLTNFTVTLNNGSSYTNETGSEIAFINQTGIYNITWSKFGWFNTTIENINLNQNNTITANMTGTNVTFRIVFNGTNVTANVSNTLLQDLNNSVNFTSSDGYYNINPPPFENTYFTVSCNREVFENRTFNLTFNARDEAEYIIYVDSTENTITFNDATDDSPISGADVTVYYPSGNSIDITTNASGTAEFSYIYDELTEFGNYTFVFDKLGYNSLNITYDINSSAVPVDLEYNISRTTIFINVYHRINQSLLDGVNVTLKLLNVFENVTDNGTFEYNNITLVSQEYTLQAIADGYGTEQITFDFTNQENLTVNLYLLDLNQSNAGTLFVQVIDEFYFKQVEATVELLEYVSPENGFITVSECLTNTNGECVFNVELNSKTYIIRAYKLIDGELFTAVSGTAGEILRTDQDVRRLILQTSQEFTVSQYNKLYFNYTESFVNNVSSIVVSFFTFDNTAATVCVDYLRVESLTETTISTECTTSSGAISNVANSYLLNRSNTYRAIIYQTVGGLKYVLKDYYYPSITSTDYTFTKDGLSRWIILIIFIGILALSLYMKNMTFYFTATMFSSWAVLKLFPTGLEIVFVTAITVVCIMGIYISRRKQNLG